ncbi:MAG: tRNA (mnm(5)s(2)U34)-methyltransferase [Oscillospiraceae bacterium]
MNIKITDWCHKIIKSMAEPDGIYIDATMGNGNDTLFLCELAGEIGKVTAFDIQKTAFENTEKLLKKNNMFERAKLIMDGHENIDKYFAENSADVICFNFGYLPGGDHSIATRADTSLQAINKSLNILKPGGIMSLCVYSGGDTGFEEKNAILSLMELLPSDKFTVILNTYYNRKNNPPIPIFILKK